MTQLNHLDGCPANRIETTHHEAEDITTSHCLDCAAHHPPTPAQVGPLANNNTTWDAGIGMTEAPAGPVVRSAIF